MSRGDKSDRLSEIDAALASDDRCRALHFGLSQLSDSELIKLRTELDRPVRIVVDEVNYESRNGLWCPLALGLDLPNIVATEKIDQPLSNRQAKDMIRSIGQERRGGEFSLNPISGASGSFFRKQRLADLSDLVDYLVATA